MSEELKTGMIKTRFAISAFIDLLGFSNHLALANNDTRTEIGVSAVNRLLNLEEVLALIDEENAKFIKCYPTIKIEKIRFNDAIFLTMELSSIIETQIGNHSWSYKNIPSITSWMKNNKVKNHVNAIESIVEQSHNVAKFVGLVARMHVTINQLEAKKNFPGARTVISTGLKVSDNNGKLDAFSANFALSNAYIVGERGKAGGFGGDGFYLEDSAANLIAVNREHLRLLSQSNYIPREKYSNPYDYATHTDENIIKGNIKEYVEADRIQTSLFGKEYIFRGVNPIPLTWIQVKHYLIEHVGKENLKGELVKKSLDEMNGEPPSLEDLKLKIPVTLFTPVHLENDLLSKQFGEANLNL